MCKVEIRKKTIPRFIKQEMKKKQQNKSVVIRRKGSQNKSNNGFSHFK